VTLIAGSAVFAIALRDRFVVPRSVSGRSNLMHLGLFCATSRRGFRVNARAIFDLALAGGRGTADAVRQER
jgi:hypothetical protein